MKPNGDLQNELIGAVCNVKRWLRLLAQQSSRTERSQDRRTTGKDQSDRELVCQAFVSILSPDPFLCFLADSPGSAAAFLASGKIYEHLNDIAGASQCYTAAARIDKGFMEARVRLALAEIKSGRIPQAVQNIRSVLEENSNFKFEDLGGNEISAESVLGDALRLQHSTDEAMAAYRRAMDIENKPNYAAGNLAGLLVQNGHLSQARELRECIKPLPRFETLLALLRLSENESFALPAVVGAEPKFALFDNAA